MTQSGRLGLAAAVVAMFGCSSGHDVSPVAGSSAAETGAFAGDGSTVTANDGTGTASQPTAGTGIPMQPSSSTAGTGAPASQTGGMDAPGTGAMDPAGTGAMDLAGMGAMDAPSAGTSGATFTDVYAIISQHCGGFGCHVSRFGAGGLSMSTPDAAYTNLVGVGSRSCAGQQRVVPGDPDASVLVQALEQSSRCAPAMPRNGPMLSAADLMTVRDWISAGAMND